MATCPLASVQTTYLKTGSWCHFRGRYVRFAAQFGYTLVAFVCESVSHSRVTEALAMTRIVFGAAQYYEQNNVARVVGCRTVVDYKQSNLLVP